MSPSRMLFSMLSLRQASPTSRPMPGVAALPRQLARTARAHLARRSRRPPRWGSQPRRGSSAGDRPRRSPAVPHARPADRRDRVDGRQGHRRVVEALARAGALRAARVVTTQIDLPRALDAQSLADRWRTLAPGSSVEAIAEPAAALDTALRGADGPWSSPVALPGRARPGVARRRRAPPRPAGERRVSAA